jgi:hypothetical protein
MKSLVTSFAVLFSIVMVTSSCNDDKDSSPSNPIVGTWVMESVTLSGCDDDEDNGEYELGCTNTTCSKVTVSKNGGFTSTTTFGGQTETDNGTYEITGNKIEICTDGGTDCSISDFQLSDGDKKLTMKEIDEDSGCLMNVIYKKI